PSGVGRPSGPCQFVPASVDGFPEDIDAGIAWTPGWFVCGAKAADAPSALGAVGGIGMSGGVMTPVSGSRFCEFATGELEQPVLNVVARPTATQASSENHRFAR